VSGSGPSELGRICRHASILVGEAIESRWAGLTHLRSDPKASPDPVSVPPSPSPSCLEEIAAEVSGCRRCPLHEKRSHTVFGEGDPAADLMFVGEGPGADEDRLGRPFVGRAGRLLDDIIEKGMGLRREQVFIANVVKCRPPGNRNPEPAEITSCTPRSTLSARRSLSPWASSPLRRFLRPSLRSPASADNSSTTAASGLCRHSIPPTCCAGRRTSGSPGRTSSR
jgi:hypothetical protein